MDDFEMLTNLLEEKGRFGIYFQGKSPFLSVRITGPNGTAIAEFLEEFVDTYMIGSIQKLGNSTVFVITGKKAEQLIERVWPDLAFGKIEEHIDIMRKYMEIMQQKRAKRGFNLNEVIVLSEELKALSGGKAKNPIDIEQIEAKPISDKFKGLAEELLEKRDEENDS